MVKRIKAPPLDLESILMKDTPEVALERLQKQFRDDGAIVRVLLDQLQSRSRDPHTPGTCAVLLFTLGAESDLLASAMRLGDIWFADDDLDGEFATGMFFKVVGAGLSREGLVRVLDFLDEAELNNERPMAWPLWVEVLADAGERGLRDERSRAWIERIRDEQPALWCTHVVVYGDDRAIPDLRALVDAHRAAALANTGPRDDHDDAVIEGIAALTHFGAATDDDRAALEQVRTRLGTLER